MTEIKVDCYGIVITVGDVDKSAKTLCYHGGDIQHTAGYDLCPFCSQPDCCFQCDQSVAEEFIGCYDKKNDDQRGVKHRSETEEDVADRLRSNGALDAIMSMVLAHAIAGIDVTTPAYIEGIEGAMDRASNDS